MSSLIHLTLLGSLLLYLIIESLQPSSMRILIIFYIIINFFIFFTRITTKKYEIRKAFLFLLFCFFLIFIVFFVKIFADSGDLSLSINYIFKTTGGVAFFFLIGFLCQENLSVITNKKHCFLLVITLIFTGILIYNNVKIASSFLREDFFLVTKELKEDIGYQRSGNFSFIIFAIVSAISIDTREYTLTILLITFIIGVALSFFCQILGSNSGLASVIGIYICFLIDFTIRSSRKNRIKIKSAISIFLLLVLLIGGRNIENLTKFRFMGFGSGRSTSIDSRLELLKNNFMIHLNYKPLIGDMLVDEKTTGRGSYIHSLIGITSHLGILLSIPFFLFMIFFTAIIIKNKYIFNYDKSLLLFSFLCCSLWGFFTWSPLWFTLGFMLRKTAKIKIF